MAVYAESMCRVVSLHADGIHRGPTFACPTHALFKEDGSPLPYTDAQKLFKVMGTLCLAFVRTCLNVNMKHVSLASLS